MNIFQLSEQGCPVESARMNCDAHVRKIPIEVCQLLQGCFDLTRLAQTDCPRSQSGNPRKHFNLKHPCAIWARKSTGNMDWLVQHGQELFAEYTRRYGKRHFTESFLDWVIKNIDDATIPEGERTEFPVAIAEGNKCRTLPFFNSEPVYSKYRLYYQMDKPFAKWERGREAPDWFLKKTV